jgi:hypothetical protein
MKFLLDIFKKSTKGDAFRATETPNTYNDGIAKLNSVGSNQYSKLTTQKMNAISKNSRATTQTTSANTISPGLK